MLGKIGAAPERQLVLWLLGNDVANHVATFETVGMAGHAGYAGGEPVSTPFSNSQISPSTMGGPSTLQGGHAPRPVAARPRVLLLGGAPITHGAVGEPLRERFEIREVVDAEAAWQAVLLDSSIRVVIADAMLPALRAFDLLARLRGSKVQRIRELPAIVLVAGGDASDSKRVIALEGTELVINDAPVLDIAAELLSRLRVLVELAATREALVDSRTELDLARTLDPDTNLLTLAAFDKQVEKLLSYARRALFGPGIDLRAGGAALGQQAAAGQ